VNIPLLGEEPRLVAPAEEDLRLWSVTVFHPGFGYAGTCDGIMEI
jgi:hypothetical protein